jgi:hypothetical protein
MEYAMNGRDMAIWELRDTARSVALQQGWRVDVDGTSVVTYSDARLRVEFTPGIAGASNPSMIDVWKISDGRPVKVLSVLWPVVGEGMVVIYLTGSWEQSLKLLAKTVPAKVVAPTGTTALTSATTATASGASTARGDKALRQKI